MSGLAAPLLFVVGPTATGKSDLAIEIALAAKSRWPKTEIISADSVQFYRELVIGSARPSAADLAKVKHHLIGHVSVADDYTAGRFEHDARQLIELNPETAFIVVGGSGFYIQALQKGLYPIDPADAAVQAELETWIDEAGLDAAYERLVQQDPEVAKGIARQDRYRIVRALEILQSLGDGKKLSEVRRDFEQAAVSRFGARSVHTLGLRLSREELEPLVRQRTRAMLAAGLVAEVRDLVAAGFADRPALQSVGYRETLECLRTGRSESELEAEITQATLRLAKKQRTWFSRPPSPAAGTATTTWFHAKTQRREAVTWALAQAMA